MYPPRGWVLQFSSSSTIEIIVDDNRCMYFSNHFQYGNGALFENYKHKLIPPEYT